jgi:hypothetical protein
MTSAQMVTKKAQCFPPAFGRATVSSAHRGVSSIMLVESGFKAKAVKGGESVKGRLSLARGTAGQIGITPTWL